MNLGIASRYAVLEDDDEGVRAKAPKATTASSSGNNKKQQQPTKQSNKNNNNDKANRRKTDPELQNLAFGIRRPKKGNTQGAVNSSSSQKLSAVSIQEDEEERRRRKEEEDLMFEKEIEEALILSKLDYEEKRMYYEAMEVQSKQNSSSSASKKKKEPPLKASLGLEKFGPIRPASSISDGALRGETSTPRDFVSEAAFDALKISSREQGMMNKMQKDYRTSSDLRLYEMEREIAEKDEKIINLVTKLTESLESKSLMEEEIKKLRLSPPENSTARLEQQIEELTREKDELTQEVARLHVAFEQERSKNHVLQLQLLRVQNSRKDSK